MEASIKKIHKNGFLVTLVDNSIWMLRSPVDLMKSSLWCPSQRIMVEEENSYYSLINLDSHNDKIEVLRI